jgi:hypothetical protein
MNRRREPRAAAKGAAARQAPPPSASRQAAPARVPAGGRLHRRVVRLVRRRPALVVGSLVLLHLLLGVLTFDPTPHTGGDNGAYITLGRSLLETGSYSELWDPAAPPHTKYPPVFPAVLALAMALGLQPWVGLKLVVLALSATGLAFTVLWLRARRRAALALGVGLLLAVAPGVLREGRWILSDVPFWAFTMLAIWAFQRWRPGRWGMLAVATAGSLLAYLTRSAGLPLVLAGLVWLGWRRRWAELGVLAAATGVPALLWWLRGRAYGPSGYVSEFWLVDPYIPAMGTIGVGDLLARVGENIAKYTSIHFPILMATRMGIVLTVVSTLVMLLAMAGWLLRMRRPSVAELYLPLYLGLVLIWPAVWSGERFLLPVLPMLLFLAGEVTVRAAHRVAPGRGFLAAGTGAALLLALAAPGLLAAARAGAECTGRYLDGDRYPCLPSYLYDEFFHVAEVSGVALPEDAVVMNRKPRLFYVLGDGVQGVIYPMSEEPAELFAAAEAAGARYLVFDQLDAVSELYLRPVILRRHRAFCIMRAYEGGTILFGILPGAGWLPDSGADEIGDDGALSFAFCPPDYWRSQAAQRQFEGM